MAGAASYPILRNLQAVDAIGNPLDSYPNRDWEQIYRDQYAYDDSFTFICAPNDTHNCRLRAFTRDGVIQCIEQNYDSGRYADQLGNTSSVTWNPRGCKKGMTFHRRVYGPYRVKFPMVRAGWKQWADDGFPELTPVNRDKYKFNSRGTDSFQRLDWDQAYDLLAHGLINVAESYSGEQGTARLVADGYQPEMIEQTFGAGTRTMKFRGGMGLLGTIGKYGMYRLNNTMALLDTHVRGVGPDEALAGRNWSVEGGFRPKLDYRASVRLVDGSQVEVLTLWEAHRDHLQDYDLDTVQDITGTPKALIERLANDIATIKPVSIHTGEGINHWFHATLHNRATYLPMMLTGNIGQKGPAATPGPATTRRRCGSPPRSPDPASGLDRRGSVQPQPRRHRRRQGH